MTGENALWAVIGLVLGLLGDVFVRPLHRFLDERLEGRTTGRATRVAESIKSDRNALRDFLVLQILYTTLIGALAAVGSGLMFGVANLAYQGGPYWVGPTLSTAAQLIAIIGAVMVIRLAGDAIRVAHHLSPEAQPASASDADHKPTTDGSP